jgi:hypothetical protein
MSSVPNDSCLLIASVGLIEVLGAGFAVLLWGYSNWNWFLYGLPGGVMLVVGLYLSLKKK